MTRRNKNRGYQQLRVWADAIELYGLTRSTVRGWPYEEKRIAGQLLASVDSVHRNIAEGYCRRSVREYLNLLNYALGSLGESVSAFTAYERAGQINAEVFESLDSLAYKLENSLLRLSESLERKRDAGDWNESLIVQESNEIYQTKSDWRLIS